MDNYYFDGQRDNEKVVTVWRRNPWTLSGKVFIIILLSWGAVFAYQYFGLITLALWLIIVPLFCFYAWFIWWNDIYILTNQRLIDIDQRKLFHKIVAEIPLENVQEVVYETKGLRETIFKFGTVKVLTGSGNTVSVVKGITEPLAVQQVILRESTKRKDSVAKKAGTAEQNG